MTVVRTWELHATVTTEPTGLSGRETSHTRDRIVGVSLHVHTDTTDDPILAFGLPPGTRVMAISKQDLQRLLDET